MEHQMNDQPQKNADTETMRIKAEHQQALARLDHEHEREMARQDAITMRNMPISLRIIFDDRLRGRIEAAAKEMAEAKGFTPPHLLDKPAACKVVIIRSIGWGLEPYQVAMSTYEVEGRVGYEGKLVRAIAEHSGLFRGAIRHEYYGDWSKLPRPSFKIVEEEVERKSKFEQGGTYKKKITKAVPAWEYWGAIEQGLGVTISATMASTGEVESIDFDLVDAYPRNATTWPTRPKLQLLNPAIRAFVNHCQSSVLMGVRFQDDAPDYAAEAVDITPADQQPQRRQPSKPTAYLDAFDALGSEYQLQAGEVADWIANRCVDGQGGIAAATGDELDALLENNDEPAIKDAIEKAIARLPRGPGPSGGGNRNTPPQAVRMPPGDDRSGAPDDTGASGRGTQRGADAAQSASSGPSAGKRTRRSYHDIKADVLAALASAADLAEVERVMKDDITSGVRANTDLMAEITAAEKTARDRIKAAATPAAPAEPVATVLGKPAATWPDAERMINEQLEAAESANAITDADYDALGVDIKALQPHMPKAAAVFLERLDALPAEDHGDEPE